MGCGSGCVVKELVIQSRLGGGFWISSKYARINEFVPAFWLSGVWGGCGENRQRREREGIHPISQNRDTGTRSFAMGLKGTGNSKCKAKYMGLSTAEIMFLLTLHDVLHRFLCAVVVHCRVFQDVIPEIGSVRCE